MHLLRLGEQGREWPIFGEDGNYYSLDSVVGGARSSDGRAVGCPATDRLSSPWLSVVSAAT